MGNLCVKHERLLEEEEEEEEEEETLMGNLKDVEAEAMKLIKSYYRMEVATEYVVHQLKYMLNDRNTEFIQRSIELAEELLETLKDDVGTNLQQAMTVLRNTLRKLPFKHKEFRDRKIDFESHLSLITKLKSEERQAESAEATAYTEDESNPTKNSEISKQTENIEDEEKQNSLRDQPYDKAEDLVAENKKLTDKNTLLNQKLEDIFRSLAGMKSDFISKKKDELNTPSDKVKPDDACAICELSDVLEDKPGDANKIVVESLLGYKNSRINSYSHDSFQEGGIYECINRLLEWLQNTLDMKISDFKEYRENISDLKLNIDKLQSALQSETKKATDISEELGAVQCKLNEQLTIAKSSTEELEQLKEITNEKMTELQQEKVLLQKQYRELSERNRQETDELKQEKLKLQDQLENMSREVDSLQQLHKSAVDENTALREEVKKLQQKPLCKVQLYSPLHRNKMVEMENEIMTIIKDKLGGGISEFELVQCEQKGELCPSFPIIVLCINVLRLGTDVSTALQDLQPNSKMAVVIFHHKNVHALPTQDSERVLTDPSFKALGGIFDVGFQHETGIYECDMNERNISKLTAFILKQVQAM